MRVPTRQIPDLVLRNVALFNAELCSSIPDLGYARKASNEKRQWFPAFEIQPVAQLTARRKSYADNQSFFSAGGPVSPRECCRFDSRRQSTFPVWQWGE